MSDIQDTKASFSVVRELDVPLVTAWSAWSQPEHIRQWWGPMGFSCSKADVDFRIGGRTVVGMRSADGHEIFNAWTYTRIEPLAVIEFVQRFADGTGADVDVATLGLPPGIPQDVRHVITFSALADARTRMAVSEYGYADDQIIAVSQAGMEQCMDKLVAAVEP